MRVNMGAPDLCACAGDVVCATRREAEEKRRERVTGRRRCSEHCVFAIGRNKARKSGNTRGSGVVVQQAARPMHASMRHNLFFILPSPYFLIRISSPFLSFAFAFRSVRLSILAPRLSASLILSDRFSKDLIQWKHTE